MEESWQTVQPDVRQGSRKRHRRLPHARGHRLHPHDAPVAAAAAAVRLPAAVAAAARAAAAITAAARAAAAVAAACTAAALAAARVRVGRRPDADHKVTFPPEGYCTHRQVDPRSTSTTFGAQMESGLSVRFQ